MLRNCDFAFIDSTDFPIVLIKIHNVDPTLEQAIEFSNLRDEVFRSINGDFLIVIDASDIKWINSRARVELGTRSKEIQKIVKEKETFIVAPNLIIKTMLKLFNSITKTDIPQTICSSLEEAMELAKTKLEEVN